MSFRVLFAALTAIATAAAFSASAAPAPGGVLFQQRCGMCHALAPAPGKMGPPLKGVLDRKAATASNYAYSAALKASKLTWTKPNLDRWLSGPQKLVPGSMMTSAVPSKDERQALIAYLSAAN